MTAFGSGWSHGDATRLIDIVAALGAFSFAIMARASHRRAVEGPRDSVWSQQKAHLAET